MLNKVTIIGHVGADAEINILPSGDAVTNFRVATSFRWTDKETGERKEETEWHRVTAFGKLAEITSEHFRKGKQVYVEGRLRTRKWQDKGGVEHYSTEIVANTALLLGPRSTEAGEDSGN